mgnify:CR=1 FL=1
MVLEFEKPIADLEQKLQEMKDLAKGRNIDLSSDIESLEEKILALKKETFDNLTRWQRVQLARHPRRPYALDYIEGFYEGDTVKLLFAVPGMSLTYAWFKNFLGQQWRQHFAGHTAQSFDAMWCAWCWITWCNDLCATSVAGVQEVAAF